MKLLIAVLATMLLSPSAAWADELRPGYLELTEQQAGQWHVGWKLPLAAPPVGAINPPQLPANCRFDPDVKSGVVGGAIVGSASAHCRGSMIGGKIAMPALSGQGDMLVRVQPLEQPMQTLRLTSAQPSAEILAAPAVTQVWRSYFRIGVEHILAGWDHLLFVIALVLLLRRWRPVVLAATAFTVAHSFTLAGAALGWLSLPQRPVEALIALSILFLSLEIMRKPDERTSLTVRYPWVIAFLFGLLHGFGFASALAAIGLPEGDIVPALLTFNLGVEAGQLCIIAAVLTAIFFIRTMSKHALVPMIRIATYAIGITASYWLFARIVV